MAVAVVDCSAFIACTLPDERPPPALPQALARVDFVVPALWPTEVANALWVALRKGRADDITLEVARRSLRSRTIEIEPSSIDRSLGDTLALAQRYQLTVYDASYLELALRRRIPLATLDEALAAAAAKVGVARL